MPIYFLSESIDGAKTFIGHLLRWSSQAVSLKSALLKINLTCYSLDLRSSSLQRQWTACLVHSLSWPNKIDFAMSYTPLVIRSITLGSGSWMWCNTARWVSFGFCFCCIDFGRRSSRLEIARKPKRGYTSVNECCLVFQSIFNMHLISKSSMMH